MLTVVVPVYNGGDDIVENVAVIRRAAAGALAPEDVELIVVSDGSHRRHGRAAPRARSDVDMHVIHYDRNLGKGYAVKMGALAVEGRLGRRRRRRPRPRSRPRSPSFLESRATRAARLRDRLEAASGLGRLLPALPPRRELVLPAAEPGALQPRRPRHAGGAEGLPARDRRRGRSAAAREAVRLRSRAARGRPIDGVPAVCASCPSASTTGSRARSSFEGRRRRALGHGGRLLPAADPADVSASAPRAARET